MADIYENIAQKIISEQEAIIGPLAVDQARKVPGIVFDSGKSGVMIEGDKKSVLGALVQQYANLFGQTSIEVCKKIVKTFDITSDQLPTLLQ